MAVKSANDWIGSHLLIQTLLVYDALPRIGFPTELPQPFMNKCSSKVRKDTKELSKDYELCQLNETFKSQHSPNVQLVHDTCIGSPVLIYRAYIQAWAVPYSLLGV